MDLNFNRSLWREIRVRLQAFIPFLRPKTEVLLFFPEFDCLPVTWFTYERTLPIAQAFTGTEPHSLGGIYPGKLLLQFELPDTVTGRELGDDEYGPLLFLLLRIKKCYQKIVVTVTPSSLPNTVHVAVDVDGESHYSKAVPVHTVDDDLPPHDVL